jgi:hypothetical protein
MICQIYKRWLLRSLDSGAALPRLVESHLQTCSDCSEFYQAQKAINEQLAEQASHHRASPSPFLETRMMAALDREIFNEQPKAQFPRIVPVPVISILLLIAAFVGAFFFGRQTEEPSATTLTAARSASDPSPASFPEVKLPDSRVVREWTHSLEDPLRGELELIVHDTKTVIQTLAQNFLPVTLDPTSRPGQVPPN